MKFDESLLDLRDEMAGCVVVLMSATKKKEKWKNKRDANV